MSAPEPVQGDVLTVKDGPADLRVDLQGRTVRGGVPKLTVKAFVGDVAVSTLAVSLSGRSIADAAREIAAAGELNGDSTAIRGWLHRALTYLNDKYEADEASADDDAVTMLDAAVAWAGGAWRFTHKGTDGKLWSETGGGWVDRARFAGHTPSSLLRPLRETVDVPRDGGYPVGDEKLAFHAKRVLGIVFSNYLETLPPGIGDDANPATEAAQEFRQAIVRLFTKTATWQILRTKAYHRSDGAEITARSSVIARIVERAAAGQGVGGWTRDLPAVDCWFRVEPRTDLDTGEVHQDLWIAFRYTLADQIGVELPGVRNQHDLTRLGTAYGVAAGEDEAPPPARLPKGGRLFLLGRDFTDNLAPEPLDGGKPVENG